jgi:DNA end-binding protein Ku
MPRVIWKGSISFGLVHVPVGLYPAEQRDELHFAMLDRRDMSPVGYKRYNKSTGEEVPSEEIVKGFEYEKEHYVLLTEDDFRRANVEATQTVEILDFVPLDAIELLYYDKPYYLEPLKKGEKGYALLREVLRRTGKVGIARVVLRTRQHIAALVPFGNMLVLELLRYHDELRDPAAFKVPTESLEALGVTPRELDMAERLVEGMAETWTPEKYRDEYRDDLLRLVEEKVHAGRIEAVEEPAPGAPRKRAEVIDLMTLLKRSVEETQKERKPAPSGGRKGAGRTSSKKKVAKKRA